MVASSLELAVLLSQTWCPAPGSSGRAGEFVAQRFGALRLHGVAGSEMAWRYVEHSTAKNMSVMPPCVRVALCYWETGRIRVITKRYYINVACHW